MDFKTSYWRTEVDKRDREKTAFTTPGAFFEFKAMPFGLIGTSSTDGQGTIIIAPHSRAVVRSSTAVRCLINGLLNLVTPVSNLRTPIPR